MKYRLRILSIALLFLFVSVWGLLFLLPKPRLLEGMSFSTAVYDNQGHLLRLTLNQNDQYRLFTPLSKISKTLIDATLLQEDQYFWHHYGINPIALCKAVWETYVVHSRRVGASTITMQVARLRFGMHSKKATGKLLQIIRALQLEIHYSKQEILEAYFNLAPFGNNIEGIGAASLIYFNKPPSQINLPEALALSIIPQNPAKRIPRHNNLNGIRQKLFSRWIKAHPEDVSQQSLMNLPLALRPLQRLPFIAPHWVNHLLHQSRSMPQEMVTTIDVRLQTILERITRAYIHRKQAVGAHNAAVLLVDVRDMGVKGSVGSVDFFNRDIQGQINGTDIKRSPGSTLKPFIYGLALDQGLIHPGTVLKDVPHSFGSYNPENFDYDFMGPVPARDALILSRNIPAIDLASQLTHPNLYQFLEKSQVSHLKPESYYGLALTLGGAELTMKELASLYAMLVNRGIWRPLRERQDEPQQPGKGLLSPEASFLILDILKETPRPEVAFSGTENRLPISWKTGTSSGYRDAWAVGSFGPYVLVVWIGNFNNKGNPSFVGKKIAAPLFFELVDAVYHERGPLPTIEAYPQNLHLEKVEICKASGMLPTRFCHDTEMTWFIPGKSPIKTDTIYREVALDPDTGLRTCHIDDRTRFEIYEFWPTDLLKIFKQAGIARRTPPEFMPGCSLASNTGLSPHITSPQTDLRYIVLAKASAVTPIPLTAVADGDVRTLYWFMNETYLGKTLADEPLIWNAKAGHFVVRVVDDHGLSDARDLVVNVEG